MSDIQLMILRRMRLPLVVVIVAYAIAVFGLTLMPGTDPEGRPWHLSLFDSFYVMSYTATTIGFGEVPYPYSYAQRLWMTFSIYLTVISWAYALGVIFALTRQPAFRAALERSRFEAGVSRLVDRFFVICGHGQSGQRLVVALDRLGYATVVIEPNPERLRSLLVRDYAQPAVGMVGDARSPDLLEAAGIRRDNCRGVVVLTADDEATQTIAIETRVLAPQLPVLARVKSTIAQQTLEDFGGVTLVNPFETFAFNFASGARQARHAAARRVADRRAWRRLPAAYRRAARPLGPCRLWPFRDRRARPAGTGGTDVEGDRSRSHSLRSRRNPRYWSRGRGAEGRRHRVGVRAGRRHRQRREQPGDRDGGAAAEAERCSS